MPDLGLSDTLFDLEPAATPQPRLRRPSRGGPATSPAGTQLDLAGDVDAALARRAAWDALRDDRAAAWHLDCCTGLPVPRGTPPPGAPRADGASTSWPRVRCGRCGRVVDAGPYDINHGGNGWLGCDGARESLHAATTPRARWRWHARRHDRRHHADCRCGHPWGFHDNETAGMWLLPRGRCWAWCGCEAYRAGPNSSDVPSAWGTSWAPPAELVDALRAAGGLP